MPLDLRVLAEPIVGTEYAVKLQSIDVRVTSADARMGIADKVGGVYGRIETPIAATLKDFAYDLKPLLGEAFARIARPIDFPVGEAHGCARMRVVSIEAGPTVWRMELKKTSRSSSCPR